MNNALISIISLLLGVFATVFVARYYFRRTIDKELTPYIDFYSELLSGIDADVRKALNIKYQGLEVHDLSEVQFLIANTGERPIRDVIKPLLLEMPETAQIMDAAILHVYPEGREIKLMVDHEKNFIEFYFDLLNKDDFFVIKLLLNGTADKNDIKFSITVDDIPPILKPKRLPYDLVETENQETKTEIEWRLAIVGTFFLLFGLSVCFLAYDASPSLPTLTASNWKQVLSELPVLFITKWLSWVPGILVTLIGIVFIFGGVVESMNVFKKKKKFILPECISRSKTLLLNDIRRLKGHTGRLPSNIEKPKES